MRAKEQPLIVGAQWSESVELFYFYGIWLVVWNSDCHGLWKKKTFAFKCDGLETVSITSCSIKAAGMLFI